ncbi:FtsH protease activity modulator HflK [Treponema sp. OMZ 792]|uniref:FtsH protease activity modulator HflK n=1 Tax=unclassified Treponema TaxID=2638727 RepID=UPI0020A2CA36|nr:MULTISPECIES: FtsH protease activity modulator HflK [unclassified Treponema]UTC73989.1 FtsH protease activity modulator HflK [Treponema sp. OMZ 792]UTC77724.1 FtsH protease activity modulator HflK [Treponema sp. OMZ 799]UTC80389.1 FtsH protease activity modulator HflK [Treponema sp. OMZ 798]
MKQKKVDPSRVFGALRTIIVLIVIALIAFSGIKVIPTTDNGVVTRFGKYTRTLAPGLNFVIPFVDQVYKVPIKTVQKEEFGFRTSRSGERSEYQNSMLHESSMLTGDLNIINVEWVIQYKIVDPKAWLFNVEESQRNKTVRDVSKSVVNSLVGDRAIMDIISLDRDSIAVLAQEKMNEKYKQMGLGISVSSVQLQNIVPPEEVQAAFEDVNIAIQDMNRLINEGKEAYNKEIPKAKGEAQKMIEEARGYASERINKAKGDVARFNAVYSEYVKAPDITRRRLYLETLDSIFKNNENVTLIDKNLKSFLPLKDLNKGGN